MSWFDVLRTALRRSFSSAATANGAQHAFGAAGRVTGAPTSSNGASSMHLRWVWPGDNRPRLREVSVVFTVVDAPTVPALYFWALQASFGSNGNTVGAAHMGLQHHPRHPDAGAVNWGGYRHGGGELEGSVSSLPSALNNVNSRDYPWRSGTRYRYRIEPSPERGWRASITDLDRDEVTVIRDVWSPEDTDELSDIVVWSEVFADCDAPSVRVEWSEPRGVTTSGQRIAPVAMTTNYQRHEDGGCANTTAAIASNTTASNTTAIAQITNAERTVASGTSLPIG